MGLSSKQLQQLKLAAKRRERRPEPTVALARPMKVGRRERDSITHNNAQLMLSLEATLVDQAVRDASIDDSMLATALYCMVQGQEPPTEVSTALMEALHDWNLVDGSSQNELALRVIHESIHTRSGCQPGERSYVNFAKQFVNHSHAMSRHS